MAYATQTAALPSKALHGVLHQDIEFEIGALASRHGISVDHARTIVEACGNNLKCIDEEARKWKLAH